MSETEIDNSRISTFTALEAYPYMSKRFLMERYLGLSEEEMQKNMELWREENTEDVQAEMPNMRSVGITPGGLETDMEAFEMPTEGGEEGVEAPEGEVTDIETSSPIPGTPPSIAAGGPATEEPPAGV